MTAASTLSEVRRISAGGLPKRTKPRKRFLCSAERINWRANGYVLGLIEKEAA